LATLESLAPASARDIVSVFLNFTFCEPLTSLPGTGRREQSGLARPESFASVPRAP
jgi:hypothetical protein